MKKPPLLKKLVTRWGEKWRGEKLKRQGIEFKRRSAQIVSGTVQTSGKDDITVILNVYKRSGYLAQQIAAIRAQTVPPAQIWIWCNDSGVPTPDFSDLADRVVISNHNWKFFGRFALANLASTAYVALFDDDILPQPGWFENCLQTIRSGYDGILGGSGVLLPQAGGYAPNKKFGWNGDHSTAVTTVDLVGHAWFARKAHYQHIWREEPYSWDNGEDIHLSYTALKYGDTKTYVPPHPEENQWLWSCDPEFGKIAGGGAVATYKRSEHKSIRDSAVNHYRQNGWRIC